MSEVDISLSKKNLRLLVRHVFIGHWILTATKVERDKELDDFFDTFLAKVKSYNVMDGLEYDEGSASYAFSADKEDEFHEDISDYEEHIFWEELIDRLATRDAIKKLGEKEFDELEKDDRMKAIWSEEEKYAKEVETHGIDRLVIAKK